MKKFKIGDEVIAIKIEDDSEYKIGDIFTIEQRSLASNFIRIKKGVYAYEKNFVLYKDYKFTQDVKELLK